MPTPNETVRAIAASHDRMAEALAEAVRHSDRACSLLLVAAEDYCDRMHVARKALVRALADNDLEAAALAAGQVAALSRLAEARLLAALERRRATAEVAAAGLEVLPKWRGATELARRIHAKRRRDAKA